MAKLNLKVDLGALREQFIGLQGRHPGLWPSLPKGVLLASVVTLLVVLAYLFYWQGLLEELETGQTQESSLKEQFRDKMKQAINLETLRKQKEQVIAYVGQLEKQLPSKAEMAALLQDITQAAVGRGLQFDRFKPGQVVVKEFYAELPISIKVSGGYHELGGFTSDVSNLARIVTLNNMNIQIDKSGQLSMEAVAKTFRYLDSEEIAISRREAAKAKAAAAKGGAK